MGEKLNYRKSGDPIFDNSYNAGTTEPDIFCPINSEGIFLDVYRGEIGKDSHDAHRLETLLDILYNIVERSTYNDCIISTTDNIKRKIPKSLLPEIFVYLKSNIQDGSYNNIEIFTCIADFLNVSYKILYDSVPVVYREQVLIELDQEYNIMSNKISSKLF